MRLAFYASSFAVCPCFSYSTKSIENPFLNNIPKEYVPSDCESIPIHFNTWDLYSSIFCAKVSKRISLGGIYTVFIKVRYNYDKFYMAGNQFGFYYLSQEDI